MKVSHLICLIIITTLGGCTSVTQYHPWTADGCPVLQNAVYDGKNLVSHDCHDPVIPENASVSYKYGFIEFDEYGNLLQKAAFSQLLKSIRQVKEDVLVVTYIHGWNHSAADDDDDVREFKLAMRNIALMDKNSGRTVIGLYVGWRGLVTSISPLKYLTFWDRKSTAHIIGNGAVTEVLLRLDKENTRRNGPALAQGAVGPNRLVFIGHSFGAAVLYSALSPVLVARFIQHTQFDPIDPQTEPGCSVNAVAPKTVGNLVVLINPAFEAMRFSTLHKLSKDCHFPPEQPPLIAVITGTNDEATGSLFPIARYVRTIWQKYADADTYPDTREEGLKANSLALGHYPTYLTHTLKAEVPEDQSKSAQTFEGCEGYVDPSRQRLMMQATRINDDTARGTEFINHSTGDRFKLILEPQGKYPNYNPILNIAAYPPIIDGHGGIYSCQLMSFIGGLITQSPTPLTPQR